MRTGRDHVSASARSRFPSMKKVAVFGSTGSVGENTLRICELHRDRFRVTVLAAGKNLDRLAEQALAFRPNALICADPQDQRRRRRA